MGKLRSRKFWLCVAAFCGSIAASISGMATGNEFVIGLGMACGVVSAACYALAEAMVDKAGAASNITQSVTSVTATSSSQKVVEQALAKPEGADHA